MLIIPPGQLVRVQIDDATFTITPLSAQQRQEITQYKKTKSGEPQVDHNAMACLALKHGLKEARGLKLLDGSDFKLKFEDGKLCDEHCQLLIDSTVTVYHFALKMSQGQIQDTAGVEILSEGKKKPPLARKA